ncbi:MAG: dihydrodipicolinate synthase family protein [SAR324 cluster bacterium]|nr:dihydrodipicolinate synthase family protein [SAR324 cluster bacterium]|tara:strand:+ start:7326 stop:8276 length:951 start_codon:yes stop_codon:yes gene_type:complete
MEFESLKKRLEGCYVTVPTMFRDSDLGLDLNATRRHVRFLMDRGINEDNAVLLAGGAAGDFSTMALDERISVAKAIVEEVDGKIPVAMGAQTTNTMELCRLVKSAQDLGADFVQISPPFYFEHTEDDFYEFVQSAAETATEIGIIIYNTFWTSNNVSTNLVDRLSKIPSVVGLKWATPRSDSMEFETVCTRFSERFTIIDNNLLFTISFMMGARAIEMHPCNYWPEFGITMLEDLRGSRFEKVQKDMIDKVMPFYKLWTKIESEFTSGDGYLDKLCMELVGLPSSRCRPPTRDIRNRWRNETVEMMKNSGVPGIKI